MLIEGKLGNLEWKGEQTLENMGIHFATCASQWQVAMWKQGLAMQWLLQKYFWLKLFLLVVISLNMPFYEIKFDI